MTATCTTALDLLHALVRIDSVNPGLDPDGGGEAQIAAWIARWGRSVGLRAEVLEGTTGQPRSLSSGGLAGSRGFPHSESRAGAWRAARSAAAYDPGCE